MPLNAVALGAAVVAALADTDPVGDALLIAMQAPIITWTIANVTVNATGGTPLIATGGAIAGTGALTVGSPSALAGIIASALSMTDPVGISKMGVVTAHYASTLTNYGQILPVGLVAYVGPAPPPTGAVTGTATGIYLSSPFTFYTALGITDAPGIAKWTAYGNALQDHLQLFATITPSSMVNPAAGGPVVGSAGVS